jgi:hypothetical protein
MTQTDFQNDLSAARQSQGHDVNPRWVIAKTGRAHLDLGERSSQSMRVRAEHVIVTSCRAHIDADAAIAPDGYTTRCSNCVRVLLTLKVESGSRAA